MTASSCLMPVSCKVLKWEKETKIHQNAVLGAEPQDFHYTGEESSLIIGDNNDIRENVVISRATFGGNATKIGNGNYLMDKVHLCHDVQINNNCVVGIGTTIAGECTLDDCVILSGNVTLHQYCHIGSWTLVQSGCRISKDVPPYVIMSGNPRCIPWSERGGSFTTSQYIRKDPPSHRQCIQTDLSR